MTGAEFDRARERLQALAEQTAAAPDGGERWLSPDEAAKRTPLTRKAIYGAIRRRELAATKRCGRWLIAESELAAWAAGATPAQDHDVPPARPRRQSHRTARGSLQALRAIEARGDDDA